MLLLFLLQEEDSDPEEEGGDEESPGDEGGDEEDEEEEAELEDPADKLRDSCAEKQECAKLFQELEVCNQRVGSRSKTEEICVQELFDFFECRDKCVSSIMMVSHLGK